MIDRFLAMFGRMSRREQVLVGTMVGVIAAAILGLGLFFGSTAISDMEKRVAEDRAALEKIYKISGKYIEARKATVGMQENAARNVDLNLKLAVNEIAKKISFTARNRRGEEEGAKELSDVVQFDQTQESFLSKKKRKKSKKSKKPKKDADVGYYRRDEPITLSDTVEFDAILRLMEKVETAKPLIYVTDIEMTRDFQDGAVARKNATFTMSTYYYKGGRE